MTIARFLSLTALFVVGATAQAPADAQVVIRTTTSLCGPGETGQTNPTVIFYPRSLNCGLGSAAGANGATSVGGDSRALGVDSTALGATARATADGATAIGANATASGTNSTAIGTGANAAHTNSTALGAGAVTTAPNQVTLGGQGTSVRVGDIGASTAAQTGVVGIATVDANGTLGRDTAIMPAIQVLQGASAAQAAQIGALGGRVDSLFDIGNIDRRDSRQGIAAAVAMGSAHFPSAPGRTSYVLNVATFRGEQAIGGSLMHRLDVETPVAVSLGFSYAGNRNNAARLGVAGEF